MGIIDQFRKGREKDREHTTPPSQGHTLAEILQDKGSSHFFGELLKRDGQEALAERIATGKLEEDDIYLAEKYRLKFSEKVAQSEKIERLLTEETVVEIARNHPHFAKIINLVGPKKAIKAIQSQLKEICITDEYRFNTIAQPIEAYDSYKNGEYKKTNDRVEKLCKDMKITPQEYLDALAIEDPEEKEKALKKLAGRTMGRFKKFSSFIAKEGSRANEWANRGLRNLKGSEVSLENSVAELDGYKRDIGSTLFYSVRGNDDMRNALSRELLSESTPPAEPKTGFGDAKKETGNFDQGGFDTAWEAFKDREAYGAAFDYEQDALKDKFIAEQKKAFREKNKKGRGIWASVFATLFERKIDDKRDTLK